MARKTYTEEDRARVRQALLDTGLNMAVSKGLKGLHLAELAAAVGISKPYFYTFFDSLEDFSLQMIEEQRCRLLRLLEFFLRLMALLDIRQEDCAPEVLANLVFSCLLIYNSAPESMPFLFPSHLEETAALHVKFLVNYLGSLRNAKKDR